MNALGVLFRRELAGYFTTPIAYVFLTVFLFLSGALTFHIGAYFERGQADLQVFFGFHPWLYVFFIPALAMRLWAEERKDGTIELLLTLPLTVGQAVVAKFLAAWAFTCIALALTAPMWITVNYLGSPDNGVILASYLGSALLAGAFLAMGCCISAVTRNQVIAFVIGVVLGLLLLMSGFALVLDWFGGWAPATVLDGIRSLSYLTRFEDIARGVLDLRDLVFFLSMIAFWLFVNVVVVEMRKAG
jgi:ABC-2 type transport system permease protein